MRVRLSRRAPSSLNMLHGLVDLGLFSLPISFLSAGKLRLKYAPKSGFRIGFPLFFVLERIHLVAFIDI